MNYLSYYGLHKDPFSNAPVNQAYYDAAQHSEALVRLRYGLDAMKGLSVLVGGIGTGKTTLARRLIASLPTDSYEAVMMVIIHRDVQPDWLVRHIALQLGVEQPAKDKLQILSQLFERLLAIHRAQKKAVVLVDEAQMLSTQTLMEEFRGLLNLEIPGHKLLSFVFFGLPEIEQNLSVDPPLAQRVAQRIRLGPFDLVSTDAYIRHRLRHAGAQGPIIEAEAIRAVYIASEGVPRLINTVCDNALLEGALRKRPLITEHIVRQVATSLLLPTERDYTDSDYDNAQGASQLPTLRPKELEVLRQGRQTHQGQQANHGVRRRKAVEPRRRGTAAALSSDEGAQNFESTDRDSDELWFNPAREIDSELKRLEKLESALPALGAQSGRGDRHPI